MKLLSDLSKDTREAVSHLRTLSELIRSADGPIHRRMFYRDKRPCLSFGDRVYVTYMKRSLCYYVYDQHWFDYTPYDTPMEVMMVLPYYLYTDSEY